MLLRLATVCGLLTFIVVSVLYAWSIFIAPNASHPAAHIDARIDRLVQYNQRLQHELERATSEAQHSQHEPAAGIEGEPSRLSDPEAAEKFAYVFYATSNAYACSVLVNIERLHDLGSALPIHVLVSPDVGGAYLAAMEDADAVVHVEDPPPLAEGSVGYYKDCLLKLLAFKMHKFAPKLERVLVLDSDQLILKNLDALFEGLPDADLAAPRAYWLAKDFISSTFMMICLSDRLWDTVAAAMQSVQHDVFDMDLVNDLFGDTVLMLGGQYVTVNSHWEDWNLPSWFHPGSELNMTTVDLINKLSKSVRINSDLPPIDAGVIGPDKNVSEDEAVAQQEAQKSRDDSNEGRKQDTIQPRSHQAPSPRFPVGHPITRELYRLHEHAAVIHFFAAGKPWAIAPGVVAMVRPDAHPMLAQLIEDWRGIAMDVCPGGIPV